MAPRKQPPSKQPTAKKAAPKPAPKPTWNSTGKPAPKPTPKPKPKPKPKPTSKPTQLSGPGPSQRKSDNTKSGEYFATGQFTAAEQKFLAKVSANLAKDPNWKFDPKALQRAAMNERRAKGS